MAWPFFVERSGASMFDLHCHILPRLDGGPPTLDAALAMARMARADGIQAIVVTPRAPAQGAGTLPEIWRAINELGSAFSREGLDLRLLPGAEVPLTELTAAPDRESAVTLAESRYMLVELPPGRLTDAIDAVWDDLERRNLRPILAGPERHPHLQRDSRSLDRWVRRGILAQLTAGSLTGACGADAQKTGEDFLRRKLVQVMATGSRDAAGDRPPVLSASMAAAAAIVGEDAARDLVTLTPLTILADGEVPYEEPLPPERPWWKVWKER